MEMLHILMARIPLDRPMYECFRVFHHAPHIVNRNNYYKPSIFVQCSPSTPLPSWVNMKKSIVKCDVYNPVSTSHKNGHSSLPQTGRHTAEIYWLDALEDKCSRCRGLWGLCWGSLRSIQMANSLLCPPVASLCATVSFCLVLILQPFVLLK